MAVIVPFEGPQEPSIDPLVDLVAADMERVNATIIGRTGSEVTMIPEVAKHLINSGGKRLRPMLTLALARLAGYAGDGHIKLAAAVEFMHTATLLHDDVVDLAERRRGQPAACTVYGNAASIFAGDWLLVAALRKIAATGIDGVLDKMLAVIDEMILAESLQLERRGRIHADAGEYFRIVEGKTASLFRWAMAAGARASGHGPELEHALDRYGLHLGIAFQAIDDELDFRTTGTGKDAFADLREGKMTYPLVVAIEREPSLCARIEAVLAADEPAARDVDAIAAAVRETGALAATRKLAEEHANRALDALAGLPEGPPRDALETVVLASLERVS